jgi:hypothetical protein
MHHARSKIAVLSVAVVALAAFGTGASAGPLAPGPLVQVSGASPIGGCDGDTGPMPAGSFSYTNSEVEPHVVVDPSDPDVLIGAWHQDRWNTGGAEGIVSASSTDGGATWTTNAATHSSFCTGGTYERSSDPWIAISPNGTAYLMTLSVDTNTGGFETYPNAMLVMRSTNHGATWGPPTTLIRDESPNVLNDKNSMTADPNDSNYVYAVWDRLTSPPGGGGSQSAFENSPAFTGDIYFTRTTNGGASWEPARKIFKAGTIAQTIGNLIVVVPDGASTEFGGRLVYVFTQVRGAKNEKKTRGLNIAAISSDDRGATWSHQETIISPFPRGIVRDPDDGAPHRTGDINPEAAVDPSTGAIYTIWQDNRFGPNFTVGTNTFLGSGIAFSQSLDGGQTWSEPIKVNATPTTVPAGNQQAFTPMIQVLNDGTIGVSYYDFRYNTADSGATTPTDAFIVHCHAASENCAAAASWDEETRLTNTPFDSRQAPVARGFFLGDYEGLGEGDVSFSSFFAIADNQATNPTDIYSREVAP